METQLRRVHGIDIVLPRGMWIEEEEGGRRGRHPWDGGRTRFHLHPDRGLGPLGVVDKDAAQSF